VSFDAADFLAGLFDGNPVPGRIAPEAGPHMSDNAPALEETAGGPTALADAPEPAPAPSGKPGTGPGPFEGWVLRPDVTGRKRPEQQEPRTARRNCQSANMIGGGRNGAS
jgi:hypothetical protein